MGYTVFIVSKDRSGEKRVPFQTVTEGVLRPPLRGPTPDHGLRRRGSGLCMTQELKIRRSGGEKGKKIPFLKEPTGLLRPPLGCENRVLG